jgi:uncharacterized protein YhbP (UPF0306 family)
MFKSGDRVRIVNAWVLESKAVAVIQGFQFNAGIQFAKVKWLKNTNKMAEEYGVLFPLDELRKA